MSLHLNWFFISIIVIVTNIFIIFVAAHITNMKIFEEQFHMQNVCLFQSVSQSVSQSKHIYVVPRESEAFNLWLIFMLKVIR